MSAHHTGIFITGSDTGVGKTYVGVLLIEVLRSRGVNVTPRKPVESGCQSVDGKLEPPDALALKEAAGQPLDLDEVCPFKLHRPLSPERAARLEGVTYNLKDLERACRPRASSFLVVEGAGGFYSPLAGDGLNADLAEQLNLPVILVAANRLGCINHTLLTAQAVARRGLELLAVVLNEPQPGDEPAMDNEADLAARLTCPVLTLAHGAVQTPPAIIRLADLLIGE